MALVCTVVLSTTSYRAGATPPPMATVQCYNPTASTIVVSGVEIYGRVLGSSTPGNPVPMGMPLPPYGPGAPVTIAAGATLPVGPFPITAGSAAAALRDGNTGNAQPSQPLNYTLMIGAIVFGSDLSRNTAGEAGMLVSQTIAPTVGQQGGSLIFSKPTNSSGWFFFA